MALIVARVDTSSRPQPCTALLFAVAWVMGAAACDTLTRTPEQSLELEVTGGVDSLGNGTSEITAQTGSTAEVTSVEETSREPSCFDRFAQVWNAASDAVAKSRTTCATDADCSVVDGPLACVESCPVAIYYENEARFGEDLGSLMQGACADIPSSCEKAEAVPCIPVRGACYSQGNCTTVCDQPGWPDPANPGKAATGVAGQFVREGGFCEETTCPALPEPPDSRFRYASSCCTDAGACGVFAWPLGPDCFERQPDAADSDQCPSVSFSLFVDHGSGLGVVDSMHGCCRADGLCGVDTKQTWGAGCVARSAIAHAAARTCNQANFDLATLEDIPCEYSEQQDF